MLVYVVACGSAGLEANRRIVRLRRELALNPPIPADTVAILEACTFQAHVLVFRYECMIGAAGAISAMAKRFTTPDQVP